jgi:competence protein ComEC
MKKIVNLVLAILFLTNFILWSELLSIQLQNNDELEIVFLDVGQGDSILIKTSENNFGLIDTGKGKKVEEELIEDIPFYINNLEFVLLTHADADHIEGTLGLLESYNIENLFINRTPKKNALISELKHKIMGSETNVLGLHSENDFKLDDVYFDILWPTENFSSEDTNNESIALIIKYGNFEMYSGGDLESEFEILSLKNFEDSNAEIEVYKAGHHGSKTSGSLEFLKLLSPENSVIPVGTSNPYGHPSPEVLENYSKLNIFYQRTDINGKITVKSDGVSYEIIPERK